MCHLQRDKAEYDSLSPRNHGVEIHFSWHLFFLRIFCLVCGWTGGGIVSIWRGGRSDPCGQTCPPADLFPNFSPSSLWTLVKSRILLSQVTYHQTLSPNGEASSAGTFSVMNKQSLCDNLEAVIHELHTGHWNGSSVEKWSSPAMCGSAHL